MLKIRPLAWITLCLVAAMGVSGGRVSSQGFVGPERPLDPVVSLRIGTQLLWTTDGLECIAGCDGTPEPIRLGLGTEWNVSVDNFDFTPQELEIEVGDSVTWTNDGGTHNVRADDDSFRCANGCDGQGGDGDPASNPWVVTLTFLDPEVIPYYCELHGAPRGIGMSGVITVVDTLIFLDGFETGDTSAWDVVVN